MHVTGESFLSKKKIIALFFALINLWGVTKGERFSGLGLKLLYYKRGVGVILLLVNELISPTYFLFWFFFFLWLCRFQLC